MVDVNVKFPTLDMPSARSAKGRARLRRAHRCFHGRPSARERMSETIPVIPDGGAADADASHSRMS